MKKETYTVAVMPSSGRSIKTFSVSTRTLTIALISLVIFVVSSISIGSFATWRYCKRKGRLANEAVQNSELLQQKFEQQLQEIRKSYSDFRVILGIEEEEPDDGAGKGGPKMPELPDIPIEDLSSLYNDSDNFSEEILPLLEEGVSLSSDFDDLTKIVDERIEDMITTPTIWPAKLEAKEGLWISSGFGRRRDPFTKRWTMHAGVDIPAPRGTPIISTANGVIKKAGKDAYLGNYIEIYHSEKFSTVYGHMHRHADSMKKGTKVERGDTIGYMGRTGRATGTHVHYEVRIYGERVDPKKYILN